MNIENFLRENIALLITIYYIFVGMGVGLINTIVGILNYKRFKENSEREGVLESLILHNTKLKEQQYEYEKILTEEKRFWHDEKFKKVVEVENEN